MTMMGVISTSIISLASPLSHLGGLSGLLPGFTDEGPSSSNLQGLSQPSPSGSTHLVDDSEIQTLHQTIVDLGCFLSIVCPFTSILCCF